MKSSSDYVDWNLDDITEWMESENTDESDFAAVMDTRAEGSTSHSTSDEFPQGRSTSEANFLKAGTLVTNFLNTGAPATNFLKVVALAKNFKNLIADIHCNKITYPRDSMGKRGGVEGGGGGGGVTNQIKMNKVSWGLGRPGIGLKFWIGIGWNLAEVWFGSKFELGFGSEAVKYIFLFLENIFSLSVFSYRTSL